jgi:acyl-CoA thioester hydrolase
MKAKATDITVTPIHADDLDAGAVLYHANYLRVCERVRNQLLAHLGFSFPEMLAKDLVLAVVKCNNEYRRPVGMHPIAVATRVVQWSEQSLVIRHAMYPADVDRALLEARGDAVDSLKGCYFSAETTLVSASLAKRAAVPLPLDLRLAMGLT